MDELNQETQIILETNITHKNRLKNLLDEYNKYVDPIMPIVIRYCSALKLAGREDEVSEVQMKFQNLVEYIGDLSEMAFLIQGDMEQFVAIEKAMWELTMEYMEKTNENG